MLTSSSNGLVFSLPVWSLMSRLSLSRFPQGEEWIVFPVLPSVSVILGADVTLSESLQVILTTSTGRRKWMGIKRLIHIMMTIILTPAVMTGNIRNRIYHDVRLTVRYFISFYLLVLHFLAYRAPACSALSERAEII